MKITINIINKSLIKRDANTGKEQLKPHEYFMIELTILNDEDTKLTIHSDEINYTPSMDGENVHSSARFIRPEEPIFDLLPGESKILTQRQFLPFHLTLDQKGIVDVNYALDIHINDSNNIKYQQAIQIDFSDTVCLPAPDGSDSNYHQTGSTYFYHTRRNWFFNERPIGILKIDPKSFKILDEGYAADDKKVFYSGTLRKGIIGKDFRLFNASFAGDKKTILTPQGDAKVQDPTTFSVLNANNGDSTGYAKDGCFAYFYDTYSSTAHATRIRACKDPSTFSAINHEYGKDDRNVYYHSTKVPKAHAATFEMINSEYAKDQQRVYRSASEISGADVASFEIINDDYSKDKQSVYYHGYLIKGADVESFELINDKYSKDKQFIYHRGDMIEGADLETFEILLDAANNNAPYSWSRDKNNYYHHDKVSTKEACQIERDIP